MSDAMEEFKKKQAEMKAAVEGGHFSKGGYISEPTEEEIRQKEFSVSVYRVVEDLARLLIDKNRKYGDSALNPERIFSKADNVAQLHTRIDDKLSRIKNSSPDDNEDAVTDLLGYLILLKIAENDGA